MSQRTAFVAKALFSFSLLAWIVSRVNLSQVLSAFSNVDLTWLAIAILMPLVDTFLMAVRWGGLLRAQGCPLPTKNLFQSCMVTRFAGQFLPSAIATDAVRIYDTCKAGARRSVAIRVVVADRLIVLLVLVLFLVVALGLPHEATRRFPDITQWAGVGAAGVVLGLWVIFSPPVRLMKRAQRLAAHLPESIRAFVIQLLASPMAFRGKPGALARALLLAILSQVLVVTYFYFVGRALGFDLAYGIYYFMVPIAVFVMLAPVTINGIGVREGIFVFLLGVFSVDYSHAVVFAWLDQGINLLYGLIGGIVYTLRRGFPMDSKVTAEADTAH